MVVDQPLAWSVIRILNSILALTTAMKNGRTHHSPALEISDNSDVPDILHLLRVRALEFTSRATMPETSKLIVAPCKDAALG